MKNKIIILLAFLAVCVVQWYVPYDMIRAQEDIIETGELYKFQTAPIDPNDPFRGKYVRLSFKYDEVYVKNVDDWNYGDIGYSEIHVNDSGFAYMESLYKQPPNSEVDYLKCKVAYVMRNGDHQIGLDFPFDKYYMKETKAPEAEAFYRNSRRDTNMLSYVLVAIKNGESVLLDVMVDGKSLKDIVDEQQE